MNFRQTRHWLPVARILHFNRVSIVGHISLTIRTRPRASLRTLECGLPLPIRRPRTIILASLTLPVLIHRSGGVLDELLRIHVLIPRLLLRLMKRHTKRMLMIAPCVGARVRVVAGADQTLDGRTSCGHGGG